MLCTGFNPLIGGGVFKQEAINIFVGVKLNLTDFSVLSNRSIIRVDGGLDHTVVEKVELFLVTGEDLLRPLEVVSIEDLVEGLEVDNGGTEIMGVHHLYYSAQPLILHPEVPGTFG